VLADPDSVDDALRTLLRRLAAEWSVRYAAVWLPDEPPWLWRASVVWSSGDVGLPASVADPERLVILPRVVATADVAGGGVLVLAGRTGARAGRGTAGTVGRGTVGRDLVALLGESAMWAGLVLRRARHAARRDAASQRADEAGRRLRDTRLELAAVQAGECGRLATAVTAQPARQLAAILADTEALQRAVERSGADQRALVAAIRSGVNDMIEQFRTVVRGVYPQVLRGGGVRAALGEIAGSLPAPVVCHGEFGRRQRWEIESGLFQAGVSAMTALSGEASRATNPAPIHVELDRTGDELVIRVRRAGVELSAVRAALRDDGRRLAALGGELRVEPVAQSGPAGEITVFIRLPERSGAEQPMPVPGDEAVGAARHLLGLLAARPDVVTTPVRVATARQDGLARVAVVGEQAGQLIRTWCGPDATDAESVCYQYHAYRRLVLEPGPDGPPWRPVRLPAGTAVEWPGRIVVEGPAEALRGMRVVCHRHRVDADLAVRLRSWDGTTEGPPDVVVCVLAGPVGAAEVEFLTALRAPGGAGFSPLTILAVREGAELSPPVTRWLHSAGDVVARWRPGECGDAGDPGGAEVAAKLRTWLRGWAGMLAERWALRALAGAGKLDEAFAAVVEANAVGAHQLAELELAQQLRGGRIRLPRGQDDALRLLGADGADARTRLGLAAGTTPDDVAAAANQALGFWRTQAMSPEPVSGGPSAYALLAGACERLLAP
jgi:signal transduction histidine kinase